MDKPFVEGQYQRGRQHGEWTYYFDNGKVNRKAIYNNGQPDGAWDVFRTDGTLSAKRSFKNGIRDGEWITYDETGKKPLREEHYVNGKADGVWKVWFPSGKLKQQAGFKEGMRHGQTIEWNENGEKVIEINYADNKPDGTAMQRLTDGRNDRPGIQSRPVGFPIEEITSLGEDRRKHSPTLCNSPPIAHRFPGCQALQYIGLK